MEDWEVEVMLKQDNRDKRMTGTGVFHRASRKGYLRGGMRTPIDIMSKAEKKEYKKAGKVESYFMDERDISVVKSIADIKAMDFNGARGYIIRIMAAHTKMALVEHWGWNRNYQRLYQLLDEYNIPYERKTYRKTEPVVVSYDEFAATPAGEAFEEVAKEELAVEQDKVAEELRVHELEAEVERLNKLVAEHLAVKAKTINSVEPSHKSLTRNSGTNIRVTGLMAGGKIAEKIFAAAHMLDGDTVYDITMIVEER